MPHATVIGLDLGTTTVKAVAVDDRGRVTGAGARAVPLHTDACGAAEVDVRDVWRATCAAVRALMSAGPARGGGPPRTPAVRAIALSGAMHSLLAVDHAGRAMGRAGTWADGRAAAEAASLAARPEARALYRRTGCPMQACHHAARLRWRRRQDGAAHRQARMFVGVKDWLLHRLTGRWVTDVSTASATGLLNLRSRAWDPGALATARVSERRLPGLCPPRTVVGGLRADAAALLGLPAGLPVVAGGTDGGLANLGAGAGPGQVVFSVGTSGAVRALAGRPWVDPRGRTWCYVLDEERWFFGGAINNGGLAIEWVRRRFYPAGDDRRVYRRLWREAASAAPGAAGLMMLPYLTGERCPHYRADLRGALLGLSPRHGAAEAARAAAEAVAGCLAQVWSIACRGPVDLRRPALLTGSWAGNPAARQILADVLGLELLAAEAADASAVGAALLGHRAIGSIDAGRQSEPPLRAAARVCPDPARAAYYRGWRERFARAGQAALAAL